MMLGMQQDMTKGPVTGHLIRFTIPVYLGNLFQQFYNMTDTAIVGHALGSDALAAVGATGTIVFLLNGFAMGLSSGFAILTSQRYGAGDAEGVRRSVASGILLSLIASIVLSVGGTLLMKPVLSWMHTPLDIMDLSYSYVSVISAGLWTTVFYNLFSSLLRAVGNSKVPLYFLVGGTVLNIILDLFAIIGLHMGVAGAAWATIVSQAVTAFLALLYLIKKVPSLVPRRTEWRVKKEHAAFQMQMGLPMALQFGITASGTMIMQSAINLFGSTAVASYTAANRVQNMFTQAMPAIGTTMATFCGQNWGARTLKRIKEGFIRSTELMLVYSVLGMILLPLLLPWMMQVFFSKGTDMEPLLVWARTYIKISVLFFIPLSLIFICRNSLQGCGYAKLAMCSGVVELVARWIVAVLAMQKHSYLLAVACDPAAWLTAGVYGVIVCRIVFHKLEHSYLYEHPEKEEA